MKMPLLIALTGLLVMGSVAPALALGPVSVDAELPVYSKYVWRGMNNTNDWVLQPSLYVGLFGFTAGVWGNMDLSDVNGYSTEFKEHDYLLAYKLGLPFLELGAGFIWYSYPNESRSNTAEFYVSAKASVLLSPSLAVYQDIDKYKGAFWEATIGHGVMLGESAVLDLTGGLGLGSKSYISGYYASETSLTDPDVNASATDLFIKAGLPFHPIPFLSITPSFTYTVLLGDAKNAVENTEGLYSNKKNNAIWGLSAAFNF